MKLRKIITLVAFGWLTGFNAVNADEGKRPNIILILSDDMGYSDLGCYGGEINTPNLDALAANGLRFSQFYNAARCCPSRASLMTGLYPHQTGIGHMTSNMDNPTMHDLNLPAYRGFLSEKSTTIAELLKNAGYATLMTGKWHLGTKGKSESPLDRGFEKFYGILAGASNYFKPEYPRNIFYGKKPVNINDTSYYTTDAFTQYAIQFIEEEKSNDSKKPFFLYLAYTAPHWPMQAPKEDIEKYRGKYMNGWSEMRSQRFARMKEMGLLDVAWQLTSQDAVDWNSLSNKRKEELDLRRSIYSAMVDRMDQNIGKLVAYLKEKGELENTLIMFVNDNGASAEGDEFGRGEAELLGTKQGLHLTYGQAWANASNTPYREYKHWVHEGGISTPFIVNWKQVIPKGKQGSIVRSYGFFPDIVATCLEVAGVENPLNESLLIAGKSLVPLFKGADKTIHTEPIFWEHEGNKAVRLGKYKLVSKWTENKETNWELYDMKKDRTEINNLVAKMPKRVDQLGAMYKTWAKENLVQPWNEIQKLRKQKQNENKK